MANAFEEFIQRELAKRPYTGDGGVEETILIRRGPGPRQVEFLTLTEGQILGFFNGELKGIPYSTGSAASAVMFTHKQVAANAVWAVVHNLEMNYFTYSVYDASGRSIVPDEVERIDENSILVSFSTPISGHVVFSFDPLAG